MSDRVVLVVSLWLNDGMVTEFEAFERKVAQIQQRHGGRIERAVRLRPSQGDEAPFEVHVVSFPDTERLAAYRADPAMSALAADRARIFRRTVILEGYDVEPY